MEMDSVALQTEENTHNKGTVIVPVIRPVREIRLRKEIKMTILVSNRRENLQLIEDKASRITSAVSRYSVRKGCKKRESRTRTKCGMCTRYWCDNCLHNRYGINTTEISEAWKCPFCMKMCSCSLCLTTVTCEEWSQNLSSWRSRHGRLYWAVPSLPYLLVEDLCREEWLQLPNKELLEELMASLNIHDDAELTLLSNVAFLQDSLF